MNNIDKNISLLEDAVLKVLAYYHIFHHPLKAHEIRDRLSVRDIDLESVDTVLQGLTKTETIEAQGEFFFFKDEIEIIQKREEGELRAKKLMKVARSMSKLIYFFPFVRGVFISGSLSKGTVPEGADIDYFIITKRNKLWIARTLLVMFKRFFLLGSKKYFCVNYFVDEDHMEIPDKNIFTATEVSTLIPLQGSKVCKEFIFRNMWYKEFYPNVVLSRLEGKDVGLFKKLSKSIWEPLFFHSLAERLDRYFMKKTYSRWTNMYRGGYSYAEFELAFRTHRGTSKNHDKNYQKRVLNKIEDNVKQALEQSKMETIDG